MKYFIKTIFIFLCPIIILVLLAEQLLRGIPNDYKYKNEYMENNSSKIEVLILGSSHSFYGVNPEYFSFTTFNLSHPLQTLDIDFQLINKFKTQLPSLRAIILPISYPSLFYYPGESTSTRRLKNYVIYYDIPVMDSFSDFSEFLNTNPKSIWRRLSSWYIEEKDEITCTEFGWKRPFIPGFNFIESQSAENSIKRYTVKNLNDDNAVENFNNSVYILSSMAKWCEDNNVQLVLITTPATNLYRQLMDQEQMNLTKQAANQIASDFNTTHYYFLLDSPDFQESDFFDSHHLNKTGAEKLSVIINQKLEFHFANHSSTPDSLTSLTARFSISE